MGTFLLGLMLFVILSATCVTTYFLGTKAKKRAFMFLPPAITLVLSVVFLLLPMQMDWMAPFLVNNMPLIIDIGIAMSVSFSASLITIGYVYLVKFLPERRAKNKTHFG